jgi:divalent metal cation (Fe/Co/Zn/Cd) transporter
LLSKINQFVLQEQDKKNCNFAASKIVEQIMESLTPEVTNRLYRLAFRLAVFTIIYNIAEGLIAAYFGYQDESLTLFGFGLDSFIEAISGLGIAHMILRIRQNPDTNRNSFERTALRITGFAFYILAAGLVLSGIYNLYTGHKPETTFWGLVISVISIAVMLLLLYGKVKAGKQLNSSAILADAECTRVCIYMSLVLLASSGIYELTGFAYIDSIGTLGLAYFQRRQGVF